MLIVNRMQGLLNRPFTMPARQIIGRYYILTLTLLLPFFLYIQQPYGINTWHHTEKLLPLMGFSVIFFASYFVTFDSVPVHFTSYFAPTSWTLGRDIQTFLIFIIVLGLFNWLYAAFTLEEVDQDARSWLRVEFETFTYALLPKALSAAIMWSVHLFKNKTPEEKAEPETAVSEICSTEPEPELIPVTSSPEEETILPETETACDQPEEAPLETLPNVLKNIDLEQIMYIDSDRNTSCIHLFINGELKKDIVRFPLKEFEKHLAGIPNLVRCSKSHIVNTRYIDLQQSRKMKKYLKLLHSGELIPASTTFINLPLQVWKEE